MGKKRLKVGEWNREDEKKKRGISSRSDERSVRINVVNDRERKCVKGRKKWTIYG